MVTKVEKNSVGNRSVQPSDVRVEVLRIEPKSFQVPIRGFTTYLSNRKTPELIEDLSSKGEGKAKQPKKFKDPEAIYKASAYLMPGSSWEDAKPRFGIPASAFKKACVRACTFNDSFPMTFMRGAFFIMEDDGGLIAMKHSKVQLRVDNGKNPNGGGAVVIYRAEFFDWSCVLTVRYNAAIITAEQIVNQINIAGFHVGVGDWRAEKDGMHGMFEVVTGK